MLHPFSIYYCLFLWPQHFPPISHLLPSSPLPQSSHDLLLKLSWHVTHMACSFFWITAWRGVLCCFWHGYPCLVDEWQQILPPQMPCRADKRSWQRARQKPPGKVEQARLQGICLPLRQDSHIWEVNSGLILNLHSSWDRCLTFGHEDWLPCLIMALNEEEPHVNTLLLLLFHYLRRAKTAGSFVISRTWQSFRSKYAKIASKKYEEKERHSPRRLLPPPMGIWLRRFVASFSLCVVNPGQVCSFGSLCMFGG